MRRLLLPVLTVAMVVTGWAHVAAADESTTTVLVHLAGSQGSGALEHVLGELDDADALPDKVDAYDTIPWAAVDVDADGLAVLERSDAVVDVKPNRVKTVSLDQTIPKVRADVTTAHGYTGAGYAVAVLDTGVQTSHPFLAGRTVAEACFTHGQCSGGSSSATGVGTGQPCTPPGSNLTGCDHGTHVAGIAVGAQASGSPAQGVARGASLVAVRVFSVIGNAVVAYDNDLLAALDWVNQQASTLHIAAVNLSLGGDLVNGSCDASEPQYKTIFDSLRANRVAPVVAAGNDGADAALDSPACVSSAISVAATTDTDALASYSNTAFSVTIGAPGSNVVSSIPGSAYGSKSGTSMATPHVAAAFAVFRQALATASVSQMVDIFQQTSVSVPNGKPDVFGNLGSPLPRLDLWGAMLPAAPTAVVATVSDHTIDLTWSAPTWGGIHGVAGYTVTVAGQPGMTRATTGTSAHYSGLVNGVSYTFSLTADNADGSSAAVTRTAAAATVAGIPTGATATRGNQRANLSWTPPAETGGVPVNGYWITASPGGAIVVVDGSRTSFSVTGLTNGTPYTFTVRAQNAAGLSAASVASAPVTPGPGVPSVPLGVNAVAGQVSATVSWSPPADDGGGGGLTYVVTPVGGTPLSPVSGTSVTVSGLTAGAGYLFTVSAANSFGTSPTSSPSNVVTPSAVSSGGGGGGGGGGGATTTTTVRPTTTTTAPPSTPPTTLVPTSAPPPTPAVSVPGGVVAVRDGVPVKLPVTVPAGVDVAAAAATPSGKGAWVVTPQGRVITAGDAPALGSIKGGLNKPIVGMASTASGKGYWLLGADGGVFSFGDASFRGSTGSRTLNQPITTLASTASGKGYWLLAADGGVFSFGDAKFLGSTGSMKLKQPVVSMTASPTGKGYWLVGRDGAVYAFGDAANVGAGGKGKRVVALAPTASGKGYWLLAADGSAIPYGDAVKK